MAEDQGQGSRGQDNNYAKRVGKLKKNLDEIERYLEILEKFPESDNQKELRAPLNIRMKTVISIVVSNKSSKLCG